MNKKLEQLILYWLRQASDEGRRGFFYDYDELEENQDLAWMSFEKHALGDIDRFLSRIGYVADI